MSKHLPQSGSIIQPSKTTRNKTETPRNHAALRSNKAVKKTASRAEHKTEAFCSILAAIREQKLCTSIRHKSLGLFHLFAPCPQKRKPNKSQNHAPQSQPIVTVCMPSQLVLVDAPHYPRRYVRMWQSCLDKPLEQELARVRMLNCCARSRRTTATLYYLGRRTGIDNYHSSPFPAKKQKMWSSESITY